MSAEHCLRFAGDPAQPRILVVPPLFDEANRLRRTLALTMRALSAIGYASLLPDLPGQNDSLVGTEAVTLADWRAALADVAAAEAGPIIVASWRGGALIDSAAVGAIGWWRMAPVAGAALLKTMLRTRIAGEREAGRRISTDELMASAGGNALELGGNRLNLAMRDGLATAIPATPAPLRTVVLGSGANMLPGTALWLRAEPGEDAAMAAAMATDIAKWAVQCAAG